MSIPAISSGIFGYPKPLCAKHMFETIEQFVKDSENAENKLTNVRLTNFDTETYEIFMDELANRYIPNQSEATDL